MTSLSQPASFHRVRAHTFYRYPMGVCAVPSLTSFRCWDLGGGGPVYGQM